MHLIIFACCVCTLYFLQGAQQGTSGPFSLFCPRRGPVKPEVKREGAGLKTACLLILVGGRHVGRKMAWPDPPAPLGGPTGPCDCWGKSPWAASSAQSCCGQAKCHMELAWAKHCSLRRGWPGKGSSLLSFGAPCDFVKDKTEKVRTVDRLCHVGWLPLLCNVAPFKLQEEPCMARCFSGNKNPCL